MSDQQQLQTLYKGDDQYAAQAQALLQTLKDTIDLNSLSFDFRLALERIQKNQTLQVTGTVNHTITRQDAEVAAMADQVFRLLSGMLGVTDANREEYERVIQAGFTNLNVQEKGTWFHRSHEAHETTYPYFILSAHQSEETGALMTAVLIALTITVEIEKEKVLFVTLKDKHNYSVQVQAIQVAQPLQP